MKISNKKFIYLISPNKIINNLFYNNLDLVLKSKKVMFFQLRLKKGNIKKKVLIAKRILKICKKNNVKFIINDNPYLAAKVNADGCHLGQNDMNIITAKNVSIVLTFLCLIKKARIYVDYLVHCLNVSHENTFKLDNFDAFLQRVLATFLKNTFSF